jgi:hypothetical protein
MFFYFLNRQEPRVFLPSNLRLGESHIGSFRPFPQLSPYFGEPYTIE